MSEIIKDIIGKKIQGIYFSKSYSNSIFTVFIDLDNRIRFRLSGYGVSYADVNTKFTDLLPINSDQNLMPNEMFIGKKIMEIVPAEQNWAYLILENDLQIGAFNDVFDKSLKIGHYTWTPNEEFFNQKNNAPEMNNPELEYEQFLNFFKRYKLDRNLEAFDFFNVLNPTDKIKILEKLVALKDYRYSVYSILCYSYAQIGEKEKAFDFLDYMYDNLYEYFDDSTIQSITDRVDKIEPKKPKSIIEQYKEIERLETELVINSETKIMIALIKKFLENKY